MSRVASTLPLLFLCGGVWAQEPAAVMKRYCAGCHSGKLRTGGLSLEGLDANAPGQHPEVWEKVVRRLRGRTMPPAGLPRPDEGVYSAVVGSLDKSLDAAAAAKPNPGRPDTFRRLNRTEYQNAIRDLLALDVDVTSMLPQDESSHGFDNVTVGDLSPTLLERYLSAAQKISRLAVGITGKQPGGETVTLPPDLTQEQHFDDLPLGTRGGLRMKYTFPVDAVYEFQLRLARDRNEHVEGLAGEHDVELMLDGERVKMFRVKPPTAGNDHHVVDKDLNVRLAVKAGPHVVSAAFPMRPSTLIESERRPYQAHFNMDRHPRIQPAVYSVSINGPYEAKGPGDTPSRRRLFVCTPANESEQEPCAKRILAAVMRRAYRRPVNEADLRAPMKFFREALAENASTGRAQGGSANAGREESRSANGGRMGRAGAVDGFDHGIEMALRAVLVSPEFLFRVEQDPAGVAPGAAYRLSDLALASRLSFFLWSSIPDDELLSVASQGKLRQPAVLQAQVKRMIADERANVLVTNFANQWLYLRNLASTTPDMRLFPDFDDNLRQAFRKETELFFESIMREDRSVMDLLGANYTFVNERLAKHYGIPNVYGSRFRRVEFDKGGVRGGLLGQGSILTVTSYATRTSPVIRGKWILDNILGVPPPPPPAAVPALGEKHAGSKFVTMRERLAAHRDNPACSGCHQLMDPVGFSLENFDAVGRWRTAEEASPVDADGGLPDGSKFVGVAGLREALVRRPEVFATTFTEKLLTYGLGRGVEFYDAAAVRQVAREAKANNYKFSSFILGVVNSTPFQMRRAQ